MFRRFTMLHNGFILILIVSLFSCREVVEPDLSKVRIKVIAPTDNLKTTRFSHTFLWEDVDDALGYNLQIVQPSFNQVQQLIVNEELFTNQFEFTLSPGAYEWRIQAFNASSQSSYQTYNITIDSTLVLTGSKVILSNPVNDFATNDSNLTFSWLSIGVADNYQFYLRNPDFNGENVITPVDVGSNSYNFSASIAEGTYEWSVKALNQFSESDFGVPRKILFDFTAPMKANLNFPGNAAEIGDSTFRFSWTRTIDNGSAVFDSLKVFSNSSLTNLILSVKASTPSHSDSLGKGTYYWYVRSTDMAGNVGEQSDVFSFTVK